MNRSFFYPVALAALSLPVCLNAQTDITWDGETDANYTTDANWVGDVAPADDLTTNTAVLNGGTVTLDASRSVYGLNYSSASTLDGANTLSLGLGGITVGGNSFFTASGLEFNNDITVSLNSGRLSFGSGTTLTGTGQLTVTGNNTVYLDNTGTSTYSGGTVITGGATVQIKSHEALGTGTVTLDGGRIGNNGNNAGLKYGVVLGAGGGTLFSSGGGYFNVTQAISGVGSLTIDASGSNPVYLDVANSFTGSLTVKDSGVLGAKNTTVLGDNTGGTNNIILQDGGTLRSNGGSVDTGSRTITLEGTGGTLWAQGGRIGVGGVITGSGQLTVGAGNNTVYLDNTGNDYSGGTLVQGLIRAKGDGTLGAVSGAVTMDGGTFFPNQGGITYDAGRQFILTSNGGTFTANGTTTINGVVSGTGDLTVSAGGTAFVLAGTNTYTGNTIVEGNLRVAGSLGSGNYAGVISGAGNVEYAGSGTQIFGGNNSYAGTTTVSTGVLLVDGAHSGTGAFTVASGAGIGGDGSIAGDLTIAAGGQFYFSELATLTVGGALLLDSTFGVDDLLGIDSDTTAGTYTLIAATGDFSGIENFGEANAYDLGDGVSAYFQNGSLQLVVVPEPSLYALLGGSFALGFVVVRRRRG